MPHSTLRRYLRHGMLPQLTVFEAAARLGSFTRAAEALHLAQPTVSTQLRKLSDTLGLPLFEQIGKRVHLTEAGEQLYAGCQELFDTLARIENSLSNLRGAEAGRLRLAVSTSGKYFAPRLLAGFVGLHPGIEASLRVHNRQALIERLAQNADDLYIFANPPTEHEVVSQVILPNPMAVFARDDHPLARERRIPFARIAEEPFLMREPGSGTRMVARQCFDAHGREPRVRMELSSNEAIKQAILAGLGVSILSQHTLGFDSEPGRLVALDVQGFPIERHWHFVYPVGKQVSVVARTFIEYVRGAAKALMPVRADKASRAASKVAALPSFDRRAA
jgi:DNA-binding transcriptional LysR family regulator